MNGLGREVRWKNAVHIRNKWKENIAFFIFHFRKNMYFSLGIIHFFFSYLQYATSGTGTVYLMMVTFIFVHCTVHNVCLFWVECVIFISNVKSMKKKNTWLQSTHSDFSKIWLPPTEYNSETAQTIIACSIRRP